MTEIFGNLRENGQNIDLALGVIFYRIYTQT